MRYAAHEVALRFRGRPSAATVRPESATLSASVGSEHREGLDLGAPHPNPVSVSGHLTLPLYVDTPGGVRVSIVDVLGREVMVAFDGVADVGALQIELDVSRLAPGLYGAWATAAGAPAAAIRTFTVVR